MQFTLWFVIIGIWSTAELASCDVQVQDNIDNDVQNTEDINIGTVDFYTNANDEQNVQDNNNIIDAIFDINRNNVQDDQNRYDSAGSNEQSDSDEYFTNDLNDDDAYDYNYDNDDYFYIEDLPVSQTFPKYNTFGTRSVDDGSTAHNGEDAKDLEKRRWMYKCEENECKDRCKTLLKLPEGQCGPHGKCYCRHKLSIR